MQRDDKSWSSDRTTISLPHANNLNVFARNTNQAANRFPLSPFTIGRTLPSKWDDAQRWIRSPLDLHHANPANNSNTIRRPKSKSGPLCRPNFPHLSSSSTSATHCFSPFDNGVMTADEMLLRIRNGTLGEIFDGNGLGDYEINGARASSRRDMATQMSPRSSISFSPIDVASFLHCPSLSSRGEFPAILDVRDVAIDKRANMISRSKRPGNTGLMDSQETSDGFTRAVVEASSWQFGDMTKDESRVKREEARIVAWENLQKARAEAAIQKLEMKLEKKRSSSMEKIVSKLRAAERKAGEMRGSVSQDGDPSRRRTKALRSWFRCVMPFDDAF